jgi:hypothetical protein
MASAPRYGSARQAAAHRDRLLGRTRAISLGIAGGALAACLGLGADFAQALPGHARPAAAGHRPNQAGPAAGSRQAPAGRRHRPGGKHASRPLSPPSQPPASTPSPPQTVSGGS